MEHSTAVIVNSLPALRVRQADSNKGDFGRALIIAGSRGMSGAAVLCGSAALRSGIGLLRICIPEGIQPTVAAANPCYMTAALPEDQDGLLDCRCQGELFTIAQSQDVLGIGPGLGRSEGISSLITALLQTIKAPIVLDADGLNAMQNRIDVFLSRPGPLILTPHPGEFARLTGTDVATIQSHRADLAVQFAAEHRLILVLKGHQTTVTDGVRLYVNRTGNAGMATGGTGDVLTGIITALLGQGLEPFPAAQLGVHVHGLAGDLARDDLGEVSLIASDLIQYLPRAFRIL